MPKVSRPTSWVGCEAVDVPEAARRLGRTENAVRMLIKKGKLKRLETGEHRAMILVDVLEAFKQKQPPYQHPLKLVRSRA